MKKETLTLHFLNINPDIDKTYDEQKPFTQEQIDYMIKQNIGGELYEWKKYGERVIGKILDAKLNRIDEDKVYIDLECNIEDEGYVNPYVVIYPPKVHRIHTDTVAWNKLKNRNDGHIDRDYFILGA